MIRDVKTDVEQLIGPIIEQEGFDLVEIKLSRYKNNYRLQIFVDSDAGVTLDNCAHLSRLTGAALDVSDIFESKYILELSSPGLDRPLHTEREFRRRIGEEVRIEYKENGRARKVRGTLKSVESGQITLDGKDGELHIALGDIEEGKVII
ncbi:MAG: ribosome maturation factor RimP [Candidatus Zixiibacteriota bacterium]